MQLSMFEVMEPKKAPLFKPKERGNLITHEIILSLPIHERINLRSQLHNGITSFFPNFHFCTKAINYSYELSPFVVELSNHYKFKYSIRKLLKK